MAIDEIVKKCGSQMTAGEKLGISQAAVNRAILHTKVGPTIARSLLNYLQIDMAELLRRYGDPNRPAEPAPPPLSPREEAIVTTVRFAPAASEQQVRAIADDYDAILKDAPAIEWLETLLREVQRRILIPQRQDRGMARKQRSEQRALRKLHDAARASTENEEESGKQKVSRH
jgi:hypothetical protein